MADSFGGFATKYIKGRFFMDVHPPLAKLLITLAGWLAGFDGEFDFKDIGKDYLEPGVPYVAMRMLPAILGVLTIPLMFLTLRASGCRTITAVLGAGVVIFGRSPCLSDWSIVHADLAQRTVLLLNLVSFSWIPHWCFSLRSPHCLSRALPTSRNWDLLIPSVDPGGFGSR